MSAPSGPSIQSITPRGLLSFGPDTPPLELCPLNVLIGPNASGKSNLIDLLRLVRSLPSDMQAPIRGGGGIEGWLWKGADPNSEPSTDPSLELIAFPLVSRQYHRHRLVFSGLPYISALWPLSEVITVENDVLYQSDSLNSRIRMRSGVSLLYEQIHIYGTWELGRDASLRRAQPADSRGDFLMEDFSNLGLFLNQTLGTAPAYKRQVVEGMNSSWTAKIRWRTLTGPTPSRPARGAISLGAMAGRGHPAPQTTRRNLSVA